MSPAHTARPRSTSALHSTGILALPFLLSDDAFRVAMSQAGRTLSQTCSKIPLARQSRSTAWASLSTLPFSVAESTALLVVDAATDLTKVRA